MKLPNLHAVQKPLSVLTKWAFVVCSVFLGMFISLVGTFQTVRLLLSGELFATHTQWDALQELAIWLAIFGTGCGLGLAVSFVALGDAGRRTVRLFLRKYLVLFSLLWLSLILVTVASSVTVEYLGTRR